MARDRCAHCDCPLPTTRRNPKQCYCSRPDCQKARKRQWQKNKLKTDPTYKDNQKRAQKNWLRNNPTYWKSYRQNHDEYTERNRQESCQRMRVKRQVESILKTFAKMDAFLIDPQRLSGYYALLPLGDMFAKMDAKFIKVTISQEDISRAPHVCKERTVSIY